MECPHCNTQSLVRELNGSLFCSSKSCYYLDLNPLSYREDIYQDPEGEHQPNLGRATQSICDEEVKHRDVYLRRCRKKVFEVCYELKLSEYIAHLAMIVVNKSIQGGVVSIEESGKKGDTKDIVFKGKKDSSIKKICAFALFAACYQREFFFEELKIAKHFSFSFRSWKENAYNLVSILKGDLEDLPPIKSSKYLIQKMCLVRGIDDKEKKKMVKLCHFFKREVRAAYIACAAFWLICQQSELYKGKFSIENLCKEHERIYEEGSDAMTIERYFDASVAPVKKIIKECRQKKLINNLHEDLSNQQ